MQCPRAGLPIERSGVQIPARAEIWFEISASPVPLANSAMMSTLTPIPKSWRDRDPNRSGTYEIFSLHYFTLQCQIHDRPFSSELQLRPNDSRFTPPVRMPVTTL